MKSFVHLHNHTEFSLLDGACRIKDLVNRASELHMPAIAITDHGVMYGVIDFYRACKEKGIKPIIGCETYITKNHLVKDGSERESLSHLILLCKNETGYRNLVKLQSYAFTEGFYYKPRIDHELLREYNEGLIALSACVAGEIPRLILSGRNNEALEKAGEYLEIFGHGNFYLEIQNHGLPEEEKVYKEIIKISRILDIPVVATNDVHYVRREDAETQDILLCIQTGKNLQDEDRMRFPNNSYYLKSVDEMEDAFTFCPESLTTTIEIANKCDINFTFGDFHLPEFRLPIGFSVTGYLRYLVEERVGDRYEVVTEDIQRRIDYELKIIDEMGFSGYFLIVQDLVLWAKNHDIPIGPGRGSAAGSIISYILGITTLDPLKYNLIFERFLNPERVTMPDIDIDVCFEKRKRVIQYIVEKYGEDKVSQIITFGTMAARAAIRDVGRVLGLSAVKINRVAGLIPKGPDILLKQVVANNRELSSLVENDPEINRLIRFAKNLEGIARHTSVHAAGVVIAPEKLDCYIPLQKMPDDNIVTQYTKETVEDMGFLKMDILGLRTLTVINHAIQDIERLHGIKIDFAQIPLNDPKTYKMLSDGQTIGVFQLESMGLRRILREVKPENIEDITAIIALYRPGPLGSGMVDDFINRKHGKEQIVYLHPWLEDILKETYGVILYQEQVMQIASRLAGFTMGEADMLRRAMSKKKPEIIQAKRSQFIKGATLNGVSTDVSGKLFDLMASFADYGFNKSHSAAYAILAFQTAYLKAHYPVEFMCSFLSSIIDNQDRLVFYLQEIRQMGIRVLPPDVNESYGNFTVSKGAIRFGLGAIKGVGLSAMSGVIENRKKGFYTSLFDFCKRSNLLMLNRRMMENMILAGAFDSLGYKRRELMEILPECMELSQRMRLTEDDQQDSLFGREIYEDVKEPCPVYKGEYEPHELLEQEKTILGFYVSGNPMDRLKCEMYLTRNAEIRELRYLEDGMYIRLSGVLLEIKRKISKSRENYAILTLEDYTGRQQILVFPKVYEKISSLLFKFQDKDEFVVIDGKLNCQEDVLRVIAQKVELLPKKMQELRIKLPKEMDNKKGQTFLVDILKRFPGEIPVKIYFPNRKVFQLSDSLRICQNEKLKKELADFLGTQNIWYV